MVLRVIGMTLLALVLTGALWLPMTCLSGGPSCAQVGAGDGRGGPPCGGSTTTCQNLVGMGVPDTRGEGVVLLAGLIGACVGAAWGAADRSRRARGAADGTATVG